MISLVHPSRNRPEIAFKTYERWINSISGKYQVEHILSIDEDDKDIERYKELFTNSKIVVSNNTCVVEAANAGAKQSKGDILILVSDDFSCFNNWDIAIKDAYKNLTCRVLKTYDGIQNWIVTLPIMDRSYYEMQGYLYCPSYRHMFVDTDQTHKAEAEGKLVFRNDICFTHEHYSTGQSAKDSVNEKADATWAQGESAYLQRVRDRFGYGNMNIWLTSKESRPHMMWLRKKMSRR